MAAKTWGGNADNWETPGDWTPAGDPGTGDAVTIDNGNPAISGTAETVASVTITGSNVGPTIDSGGSLHTTGDLSDGGSIQLGNMSAAGSANALTVDGQLSVTGNITSGFNGGAEVHNTISADTLNVNNGAVTMIAKGASTATMTVAGTAFNNGIIQIDGGSATIKGNLTGGGFITIDGQGTDRTTFIELGGACDNSVGFEAGNGTGSPPSTLKLDNPAAGFTGQINSFAAGDVLDLAGEAATIKSYNGSTLVVTTGSGATQSFAMRVSPTGGTLRAVSDGAGGTDIEVVCFASGTLIATRRGEVAVEHLTIGDVSVTSSGTYRPIRWLGHRTIDCHNHPRPHEVMPIRISAHAFGASRPARDLYVSPGHAICVDVLGEVLIPAGSLVNGSTIQQVEVDEVTYWHVELDSHDIILAENLPAESYLDMGNRGFFSEADVVDLAAGPDFDPSQRTHADFCRPFHAAGSLVEVVKAQLAKRAEAEGWSLETTFDMHLVVDGQRVDPAVRGFLARFEVPAGAKDVWLVSPTARPCDTMGSGDRRNLGLCIGALRIDDGFDLHDVSLDDPLLCIGFYEVERGARRWTAGRAGLPAALWESCGSNGFNLRVELAGTPVPRWTAPPIKTSMPEQSRLAIVA